MPNNQPAIAKLLKTIERHRAEIAKSRDALRDAISEADGLAECCDRADGALEEAIDALSELA